MLSPGRLPDFHRIDPPAGLEHAVRWFWIPEWSLLRGVESRQELLPFPACNLVVEPDGVTATGPPTRRSERVLSGSGWAVGALLRAAAAPSFIEDLAALRDSAVPVDAPELLAEVVATMGDASTGSAAPRAPTQMRRERAIAAFAHWLRPRVPALEGGEAGGELKLVGELERLLTDPAVTRADQLPPLLHIAPRTLQRLAERHFGLSPHSMIRRRRLQEAAERLREDPSLGIGVLASELSYADHAHFTRDFGSLLGVTPSKYRELAIPSPGSARGTLEAASRVLSGVVDQAQHLAVALRPRALGRIQRPDLERGLHVVDANKAREFGDAAFLSLSEDRVLAGELVALDVIAEIHFVGVRVATGHHGDRGGLFHQGLVRVGAVPDLQLEHVSVVLPLGDLPCLGIAYGLRVRQQQLKQRRAAGEAECAQRERRDGERLQRAAPGR